MALPFSEFRARRLGLRLTQAELARLLGVEERDIRRLERRARGSDRDLALWRFAFSGLESALLRRERWRLVVLLSRAAEHRVEG